MKSNADAAELALKRDYAFYVAALAEAKKGEESLKKAVGIEKEHEMGSECVEAKVVADIKLAEARSMMEEGLKKMTEANAKMQAVEGLESDAGRARRADEQKLREVEAHEDDLRRQMNSFRSECEAKVKEILLERQSLAEQQKSVQPSQERLLDGQALLNQREGYICSRTGEISRLEKELQASRLKVEDDYKVLKEEKYSFNLKKRSLDARDEDITLKENESKKKYQELQIEQEKVASKQFDRIKQVLADNEAALKERNSQFEAELETKLKLTGEKIENKSPASELREVEQQAERNDALKV